ncbi:MAG: sigma-E factor negative regulatory protein [Oxalobacteraceae bacterium]
MNKRQQIRQRVSELADGELQTQHVQGLLEALRGSGPGTLKEDWDLYHRIGDCLRNERTAADLSDGFARRLQERLDAEPVVLAPRRRDFSERLREWGVALTAVAAAAASVALSPSLFHPSPASSVPSLAAGRHAGPPAVTSAMRADAGGAIARDKGVDYILLHLNANSSLYGAPVLARQAAFSSAPEK